MDIKRLTEIFGEWPLRVGEFHKVSFQQFEKDWLDTFCEPGDVQLRERQVVMDAYDTLNLPVRATGGSGGYDFSSPLSFVLEPGEEIKIPTGIRVKIQDGWILMCVPRSGSGNKYYIRIAGTLGVIDWDYFYSNSNSGHCFIKIRNEGTKRFTVNKGDKICQAIFVMCGITNDDNVTDIRDGGFGSTGN